MKLKFSRNKQWIIAALAMVTILLGGLLYVTSGKKFDVVYSAEVPMPGYETRPAEIYVFSSTSLKWAEVPAFWKVGGFIWLFCVPFVAWYVGTDRVYGKKKPTDTVGKRSPIEVALFFAPVLLCLVFWFAGYSSSLAEGKIKQPFDDFKKEYRISDELSEKIKKQEVTSIKDDNGLLTAYFKAN